MTDKRAMPETVFGIETDLARGLILPFFTFVAFVVITLGVVVPKVGEIGEMNQKAKEIIQKRNGVLEKKNYILSVDQNDLKRNVVLLNNSLLREKNWYVVINVVNRVAQSYGFQIESFSVTPGKVSEEGEGMLKAKTDVVAKIPVNMILAGPQKSYLEFVLALEKTLPLLVIDKFEMKSSGEIVQLDLIVSSYYMGEQNTSLPKNLTLTDLTLKKEENEVLKTLWAFANAMEEGKSEAIKEFVRYQRNDPFSL